jgi:hypothetical protein
MKQSHGLQVLAIASSFLLAMTGFGSFICWNTLIRYFQLISILIHGVLSFLRSHTFPIFCICVSENMIRKKSALGGEDFAEFLHSHRICCFPRKVLLMHSKQNCDQPLTSKGSVYGIFFYEILINSAMRSPQASPKLTPIVIHMLH